jgi:transglutaminase-like putative cysteine protease
MPHFHILHRTHYIHSGMVIDSVNQVKLYPLNDDIQNVKEHHIRISQQPIVHTIKDYFGNTTGFFTLVAPHHELIIDNMMELEMLPPKQMVLTESVTDVWKAVNSEENQLLYHDFLKAENARCQTEVQQAVHEILGKVQHPLETILELSNYIYDNFTYRKGVTNIETSVDELWQLRAGVCQDFAHLLLYMLRLMGVPARYISGYICPGSSEWRGEGATHAWAEAWLPDTGWIGIDPTNKCLAGERHVRLATGRNFSDCTPVKGTYKGAVEHKLEVTVKFGEKAFTDAQLINPTPTFTSGHVVTEIVPRNSYTAYMQMQQQQQ